MISSLDIGYGSTPEETVKLVENGEVPSVEDFVSSKIYNSKILQSGQWKKCATTTCAIAQWCMAHPTLQLPRENKQYIQVACRSDGVDG
jgi:hypothetical protein